MVPREHGPGLIGRRREQERLDRLIASVRGGESRALVIRAEAGLGKTLLLDHLAAQARGCRVLRVVGVESEMELAHAGLQQLCAPIVDGIDALPEPQSLALGVALGLRTGPAPDRFLLGLAVLGLLSHAAEAQPLLCLVDDAQWLDQASSQVLTFAARRLVAESVGLVFAVREPVDERFAAIEDLVVRPLDDDAARTLLGSVLSGPIDPAVRDRIIAEAHGNPLALVELHRGVGEFGPPAIGRTGMGAKLEDAFRRRIERLSPETRRMLLIAALEPVGDPALVLAAGAEFDLDDSAIVPAIEAELLELGGRLRFRHPMARSAVLAAESAADRRAAHRAIAEATDPDRDPDRRAWHLAESTIGFDEEIAAELVHSADRARLRGGMVAAARFHARGAELTPDRRLRSRRTLMAAEDTLRAGAANEALRLLDRIEPGLLDAHQRARAELVRGHAQFYTRGTDSVGILLEAARSLESYDGHAAVATYSDALIRALLAGSTDRDAGIEQVAAGILAADPSDLDARSGAAFEALRGLAILIRDGYAAAAPTLRAALAALRSPAAVAGSGRRTDPRRGLGADVSEGIRAMSWMPLTCLVARVLLDDAVLEECSREFVDACLADGVLSRLAMATAEYYPVLLMSGRIAEAEGLHERVRDVMSATDVPAHPDRGGWFAAYRGDDEAARRSSEAVHARVAARRERQWLLADAVVAGVLHNSQARYAEALAATTTVDGHPFDLGMAGWVLPEQVEAAVRSGDPELGRAAAERLDEIAAASGTDLAVGLAARSAALLADDADAEALYLAAIDALARTRIGTAQARAHLLYGEWLRRQNRRVEARESLRLAHERFVADGAHAFAERAARELSATGEIVHRSAVGPVDELTAQERQIARLAAGGATNPEIGAQLFLSPRTVEWHLRKVFGKLAVTSRRQLAAALRDPAAATG
ncbi:helix-turn-helix transcriptional regulator [Agromyces seonyuensis]|uniref:AAA family ATPase n=1 Tax=Agromyces seonyuensis TaxID=2662446 RepID=A0A6I4NTR4_9MICO|nr:LuxR family transcriptional regulator [Agromyces seonyuensis]MWB97836.1 AAA family ATPase [Agromyces seonyuensis]